MKKNDWKYLITALLFVNLCSIAAVGLLLAFVIPAGNLPHGPKVFLGLHRHAWIDFHLYLALFLMGLLTIHLWLGWSWVAQTTKRYFGRRWKRVLLVLACAWFLVLLLGWIKMRL